MEPITRREFTDPVMQKTQDAAIELAEKHTDQVLADYAARLGTFGGRYVATDMMKELMPGYPESRSALNNTVEGSAFVLASEQFRRVVDRGPQEGRDTVVLVTGIPGAGKSSTVVSSLESSAAAVYEGLMRKPGGAEKLIDQALEKGFKVEIVVVHMPPEIALERTNIRYLDQNNGRGASLEVMADTQGNMTSRWQPIHEKYDGQPVELRILDNTPGKQEKYTGWGNLPFLEKEGNHEQVYGKLTAALEAGYREGRYSDGFYIQATGKEPEGRLVGGRGNENDRGQQENGIRPGISQGNSAHSALEASPQSGSSRQSAVGNAPAAEALSRQIQSDLQRNGVANHTDERRALSGIEARGFAFSDAVFEAKRDKLAAIPEGDTRARQAELRTPEPNVLTADLSRQWATLDAQEYVKIQGQDARSDVRREAAASMIYDNMRDNPEYKATMERVAPDVAAAAHAAEDERRQTSNQAGVDRVEDKAIQMALNQSPVAPDNAPHVSATRAGRGGEHAIEESMRSIEKAAESRGLTIQDPGPRGTITPSIVAAQTEHHMLFETSEKTAIVLDRDSLDKNLANAKVGDRLTFEHDKVRELSITTESARTGIERDGRQQNTERGGRDADNGPQRDNKPDRGIER